MKLFEEMKKKKEIKKEIRLIEKVERYTAMVENFYVKHGETICHCSNCRALLNDYGTLLLEDNEERRHIKCMICGYVTTKNEGPFVSEAIDSIYRSSVFYNSPFYSTKIIDKRRRELRHLKGKATMARLDLNVYYQKRDGFISYCPLCQQPMNRFGRFNVWKETCNPYEDRNKHDWTCMNCGNCSVWLMKEGEEPKLITGKKVKKHVKLKPRNQTESDQSPLRERCVDTESK
jgi:hypothetical protein